MSLTLPEPSLFANGGEPIKTSKGSNVEERDGPQATYFRVPNPRDARLEEDELLGGKIKWSTKP